MSGEDGLLAVGCDCGAGWWAVEVPRSASSCGEFRPATCPWCGEEGVLVA